MKFTKAQHTRVLKAIEDANRLVEEFSFVKRKGRINIIEIQSQKSFVYFKKKTTNLDPDTQSLVSGEHFLVFHSEMKEQSFASFDGVIFNLTSWLSVMS
jgi:hypothetical protein